MQRSIRSKRRNPRMSIFALVLGVLAVAWLPRSAHAGLVVIPENRMEGGAEIISITNYTWAKSSKVSICETQATKDCNADVKLLSDVLRLFNIGAPGGGDEAAIFFFSDEAGPPEVPVIGGGAADIFLSEEDGLTNNGKFPPILFGAKDNTGKDQTLQLIIFSDPDDHDTSSDSVDITAVQIPGQPAPPVPIIVTTLVPEPAAMALLPALLAVLLVSRQHRFRAPREASRPG